MLYNLNSSHSLYLNETWRLQAWEYTARRLCIALPAVPAGKSKKRINFFHFFLLLINKIENIFKNQGATWASRYICIVKAGEKNYELQITRSDSLLFYLVE